MKRIVVEDCEIVKTTKTSRCSAFWLSIRYSAHSRKGSSLMPTLPLLRSQSLQALRVQSFACRTCHNLTYTVQKHDVRLDRLLRLPDSELKGLVEQNKNIRWKLLAIRAAYIRLGLIGQVLTPNIFPKTYSAVERGLGFSIFPIDHNAIARHCTPVVLRSRRWHRLLRALVSVPERRGWLADDDGQGSMGLMTFDPHCNPQSFAPSTLGQFLDFLLST